MKQSHGFFAMNDNVYVLSAMFDFYKTTAAVLLEKRGKFNNPYH